MLRLCLLLTIATTSACAPAAVCGEKREDSVGPDGGVYLCARAEDCPRRANTFVCETDDLPQVECVSCTAASCVRHIPVLCN